MMNKVLATVLAFVAVGKVLADDISETALEAALADDGECAADADPATCWLNALQLKAQKEAAVDTENEESQNSCTAGLVGQIRSYAPSCIDSCQQTCGAIGSAINAYLTKGGQPAAIRAVCQYKHQFGCFFQGNNLNKCRGLISKAAGYGFQLPTSQHQLNSQCR
eukprot:CAMPEP_0206574204 /NCGR_PEP_ID=MMETSP0325_2-20121206/29307_1 /ASSEMBLY_ACC=CAM_ASM_000347 /TAXON_ID=2866 /ORGANISM="Crypthecodinium cohnii, Strain Seligo" /LENGTH=164 /DNA_ID=CAMNT_0054078765 /DNA_START=88 /DNA_END=582 /DNA_ORIENTATION=-